VTPVVVAPSGEHELDGPEDLAHRTLYVRHSSAYWDRLDRLRASGIPLILQAAPEHLETEEIIGLVADGKYSLTVAHSHVLGIELSWRRDVRAAFPLGDPVPLAWVVRETNPELRDAADRFLEGQYGTWISRILYDKYFEDPQRIRRHVADRNRQGGLSAYDEIVRRLAARHQLDWRLIVSQIYQESQGDPRARSLSGAVGLLQVLPGTGAELGVTDLEDPESNIQAGLSYLASLRDRFEDDLHDRERMHFALAAYNVGWGHVQDARTLAAEVGWNPNRWFGEVERAMLLLARPEYARRATHGYCRGSEPMRYVRDIQARYDGYVAALTARWAVPRDEGAATAL
jgi:membrane-bound lytic murein transglycosylase F